MFLFFRCDLIYDAIVNSNYIESNAEQLYVLFNVLYPELDGKSSGTPVLTERLVTEGCWFRFVWTLKNYIHESNSTLGTMNEDLMHLEETFTISIYKADLVCSGDI